MASFSFGFSGDDIDADATQEDTVSHTEPEHHPSQLAEKTSAFPIPGKPQLPPTRHDLGPMLSSMPSKIAYSMLDIVLDSGEVIQLPRRELWDVRVQLMAEAEEEDDMAHAGEGLGDHDVKTGVYEGGFKSWESSVDLVKVLATQSNPTSYSDQSARVIEVRSPTLFRRAVQPPRHQIDVTAFRQNKSLIWSRPEAWVRNCSSFPGHVPMGHGFTIITIPESTVQFCPGRLQPICAASRHTTKSYSHLGIIPPAKPSRNPGCILA
jgi:hypothetical protein